MTNANLSTTNTALTVVNLDESRVTRGQLAWSRIKATAADQRELWRQVGEALLVGRRLHRSNTMFSLWCERSGFGDMNVALRSDAMWLVENWNVVFAALSCSSYPAGNTELTQPKHLRQWYREVKSSAAIPESLADLTITEKPSVTLDQRSAEKLAKVINRANSGDEGSETAKRHVESIAKKHGVSSEELKEVVANTAPATFYQFSPDQLEMLEDIEETVLSTVVSMEAEGLTREAIAAVFIKIANRIKGEKA